MLKFKKKYFHFLLVSWLVLQIYGCSGDAHDFDFSILADPLRSHVPVDVAFSLVREDAVPITHCDATWRFGDGVLLVGEVEASHKYKTPSSYTVEVDLDCGTESSSSTIKLDLYPEIDLALNAMSARPLDVSTDGFIEVSMHLSNLADTPLRVPTTLDIYLSPNPDDYTVAGAMRVYRHVITDFPAASEQNSTQKLEFSIPVNNTIRTGSYYAIAIINPDGETGEYNLSNNTSVYDTPLTVRNQSTDGADLEAARLQMSPEITSILSSATASFEFLNQGSTTAEEFAYEIWLAAKDNADNMEGATLVSKSHLTGSVAGIRQTVQDVLVSVTPPITDPGLYYFWLVLDSDHAIVERDETNNMIRSVAPIQVTNEPVLNADIIVQNVAFSPTLASRGSTFSTTVDIYNQGSQPTGSFICTVFLSEDMSLDVDSDKIVGSINMDDLHPTSSIQTTAAVEVDASIAAGDYYVYVFCDSSGVVAEAIEDNNIQRSASPISIAEQTSIDLLFSQTSSLSPEAPNDGDEVSVTTQLCNNGSTGAGPNVVSLIRNNLCDASQKEVTRTTVDGIEAGQCTLVTLTFDQVCDFWCPSYGFTFVADATNVLAEDNEKNNSYTPKQVLTTMGRDCICDSDPFEPNNVTTQAVSRTSLDDDLTLCPNDEDWFRLDIHNDDSFRAHLSHLHTRSPLTMELWRNDTRIDAYSGADDLYLEGEKLTGADEFPYYIRVYGANGAANHYHLSLDTYTPSSQEGIDVAASGLTVAANALSISEWRDVSVLVHNHSQSTVSNITLGYYLSQTGNLDDTAVRLASTTVKSLSPGAVQRYSASLKLPADTPSATYHVIARIDDAQTLDDIRPDNNIAHSNPWRLDKTCWDTLDPNESFDTASNLTFNHDAFEATSLRLCRNNEDYYQFVVEHGHALDISVTSQTAGDYDIVLYDHNYNEIASSRTSSLTETISRDIIVGDQTLYLRVFLNDNIYNAADMTYDLSIKISPAQAWLTCDSHFEPNNFFSSAIDLKTAAKSGQFMDICPHDDEDFFSIYLVAGQPLNLAFETEASHLRAALYGGDERRFIAMLTNLKTQSFDYTATKDATYWVRVFTNASEYVSQSYRLLMQDLSGVNYGLSNLSVLPDNPIANQAVTVSFDITNHAAETPSFIYYIHVSDETRDDILYRSTLVTAPAYGETETYRHKLTLPGHLDGDATLSVVLVQTDDVDQSDNTLSRTISVLPSCQADTYEPNDTALSAKWISSAVNATVCENDQDWYTMDVTAETTLQLSFDHENGDLDLYVYAEDGSEIGTSATASNMESVAMSQPQRVFILVKGVDSSVRNTYTLSF